MKTIRRILLAAAAAATLAACGTPPEVTVVPPLADPSQNGPAPSGPLQPQATPGEMPRPLSPPEGGMPDAGETYMELTYGDLWARLYTPLNGEVVTVPQVLVRGEAPEGAVVSINAEILVIGADERFELPLALTPGPNYIEIIVSDGVGNEVSFQLTVFHEAP